MRKGSTTTVTEMMGGKEENEHFYVFASRKFAKRPLQWKQSFIFVYNFFPLLSFELTDANFNTILYNLMKCATTMFTIQDDLRRYWQWNSLSHCWLLAIVTRPCSFLQIAHVQKRHHHHHCHRLLFIISVFATIT